jgi:copper chaperone CopZ
MSCAHCVAAVSEQVSAVRGVERVAVDLASGSLAIEGEVVDAAEVKAAVEAAGYALV